MKNGKIILTGLAFVAAIGGAFAFKAQKKVLASTPIYRFSDGSQLTGCYLTAEISCGVTAPNATTYYYFQGATQTPVPANTVLLKDDE